MKRTCQICSKTFYKSPSVIAKGFAKFCSRKCEVEGRPNKPLDCTCIQCGIFFKKPYWDVVVLGSGGRFCSRICIDKFKRTLGKGKDRSGFTWWQKRDWKNDKCERCGSDDDLELDHKHPRFAGGMPTKDNAQTLCRSCNLKKFWRDDYPLYKDLLVKRSKNS